MEPGCSAYLGARVVVGALDTLTDLVLAGHLLAQGRTAWAAAVLAWVALGVLAAAAAVVAGRWRRGNPMSVTKFLVLSLRVHAEAAQAWCEAAPMVLTQLAMVWSGVTMEGAAAMVGPPSWAWAAAWGQLASILLSITSLLVTAVRCTAEPGPPVRVATSTLALTCSLLYRAAVLSVLVKLAPLLSSALLLLLAATSAGLLVCWGDPAFPSLLHGTASLLLPLGHSLSTSTMSVIPSGLPEAERSRINQEELLRRTRRVLLLHTILSLLLLIPYFIFLELFLHSSPSYYEASPLLFSRPLTHSLPLCLLLLSLLSSLLYHRQAVQGKEAARAWTRATSPRPSSPRPLSPRPSSPLTPPSPSRPMRPGDVLSAHISRGGRPASPPLLPPLVYPPLPSAPPPPDALAPPEVPCLPLPPGARRCGLQDCVTCVFLIPGSSFQSTVTGRRYKLMTPVTCTDSRLVYLVTCRSCSRQYVGKTDQTLRQRHYGHRREIETLSSPLGRHFGEGCGYESWQLQIIDVVGPGVAGELGRREGHWQQELRTIGAQGLNTREERRR